MNKSRSNRKLRRLVLGITAGLILLSAAGLSSARIMLAHAAPLMQDPTAYPPATDPTFIGFGDDYPYPVMTPTDFGPLPTQPDTFPTQPQGINTPLPQQTQTLLPNTFLTENAEMGEGQTTPLAETHSPAVTATETATPGTATLQPTPIQPPASGGPGGLNWGLFWIGFSLPVLAACGWILYLLDRRPDLFRSRG